MKTITYDSALWQLVPKVPTENMKDSPFVRVGGCDSCSPQQVSWGECADIYLAMLAAAPSAPEQPNSSVIADAPQAAARHDSSVIEQPKQEGLTDAIERFTMYSDHGRTNMMGDDDGEYVLYSHHQEHIARALLASQPAEQAPDLFKQMGLPDAKFPGLCGAGKASQPAAPVEAATPAQVMTDDQIIAAWDAQRTYHGGEPCKLGHLEFARAILAAAELGKAVHDKGDENVG